MERNKWNIKINWKKSLKILKKMEDERVELVEQEERVELK